MESIIQELVQQWGAIKAFFVFDSARLAEPDMIARLSIQVLLLCGSAFFSGSETALFSLSRLDLQKLRRERNRHTETLHALLDQPRRLIISILCGNELVNIAAAAAAAAVWRGDPEDHFRFESGACQHRHGGNPHELVGQAGCTTGLGDPRYCRQHHDTDCW
jgi:hypothetical protein